VEASAKPVSNENAQNGGFTVQLRSYRCRSRQEGTPKAAEEVQHQAEVVEQHPTGEAAEVTPTWQHRPRLESLAGFEPGRQHSDSTAGSTVHNCRIISLEVLTQVR